MPVYFVFKVHGHKSPELDFCFVLGVVSVSVISFSCLGCVEVVVF